MRSSRIVVVAWVAAVALGVAGCASNATAVADGSAPKPARQSRGVAADPMGALDNPAVSQSGVCGGRGCGASR